jgi:hypothetical protein
MSGPRVSIGWLMVGIALLGVPCALVRNAMAMAFGSPHGAGGFYDLGLWPGLVASMAASYALFRRRGVGAPFLWGFAAGGWASTLAYLACCWSDSAFRLINPFVVFYFNNIVGAWALIDADTPGLYALDLLVLGLYLGHPQLLAAVLGGLVTRWAWRFRWTSTWFSRAAG